MKGKKLWAIILTVCLIVSSIGVISVMAEETDVKVSVTTDKSTLKAGDEVTVSVNLDEFKSTVSGDEKKLITTMQFEVAFNDDVFEYVAGSLEDGAIEASAGDANVSGNKVIVVAVYSSVKKGAIEETDETLPFLTFKLKVKDDVTSASTETFTIDNLILKNMYLEDDYVCEITDGSVDIAVAPVISVNGSATVAATYTEGVTISASEDATITVNGEDMSNPCEVYKAGTYTVVATSNGMTDEETFEIAPVVSSIAVKTTPDKTEYVKGSELDLTGGVITATLSNTETKDIDMTDTAVTVTGFDSNPATFGEQTITVTYEGKTATFAINMKDKEVTEVELATDISGVEFIEGQDIEYVLAQMAIQVTYDTGESEVIENITEAMVSGIDMNKVGEQTYTITYGGKSATGTINVRAKVLCDIKVSTKPTKTTFVEGTAFSAEGGVVTAYYDNGKSVDIDMTDAMCSGYDMATVGEQQVTVTYTEGDVTLEATYDIVVKEKSLDSIAVTTQPTSTTVLEGKDLDVAGGVLTLTYDNGTTATVDMTADMISGFDNRAVGSQTVTVSYTENGVVKTTTLDVTVKEKSITSIDLYAVDELEVIEGLDLDFDGAVISVIYDNGEVEDDVVVTADMVTGYDKAVTTPGTYTLTVKYKGVTAGTIGLTVLEKSVTKVEITENNITEIKEAKSFSYDGKLTVSYDNGTTEEVAFSDASVKVDGSAVDTAVPGEYKVVVTYTDNKSETHVCEYTVKVVDKELTGIAVTEKPAKLEVIEGLELDLTGCKITASYDNDTTEVIDVTKAMLSGFDNTAVGKQTVTVTYNGKTATMEVEVLAKSIVEVTLVSAPTATTVTEGMDLDLAGGKIHVVYNNNTEEDLDITADMVTVDTSVVGDATVIVNYGDAEVSFDVEVIAKVATGIETSFDSKKVTVGTELADTGLTVSLVYNNGTKDVLDLADVTITGYDKDTVKTQEVVIEYTVGEETFKQIITIDVVEEVVEEETTTQATEETTTTATEETTTGNNDATVNTGDSANVIVLFAIIALAGAGFVVSRKKVQM